MCDQCESEIKEYECIRCNELICGNCIAVDGIFDKHIEVYCEKCRNELHITLESHSFNSLIREV